MLDQLREALAVERPTRATNHSNVGENTEPMPGLGMNELEAALRAARQDGRGEGYRRAWEEAQGMIDMEAERGRVNGETTGALGALRLVLQVLEDRRPAEPGSKERALERGVAFGERGLVDELVMVFERIANQLEREGSNGERQAQAGPSLTYRVGVRPTMGPL
jgi:hypothetical protein